MILAVMPLFLLSLNEHKARLWGVGGYSESDATDSPPLREG